MTFNDLFKNNFKLKNDPVLASRMMAMCLRIAEIAEESDLPPVIAAKTIV